MAQSDNTIYKLRYDNDFCKWAFLRRKQPITKEDFVRNPHSYFITFKGWGDFKVSIQLINRLTRFKLMIQNGDTIYEQTDDNPIKLIAAFDKLMEEAGFRYNYVDDEWAKWGF